MGGIFDGPKDFVSNGSKYLSGVTQLQKLLGSTPRGQPGLADQSIQNARTNQLFASSLTRGRKSTFLGDSTIGEGDAPPATNKTILGG